MRSSSWPRSRRTGAVSLCAALLAALGGLGPSAAATDPADSSRPLGSAAPPPTPRPLAARYQLPIAGAAVIVRAFRAPPTPYAAGHRGVDLATAPNQLVFAAASGRVGFAGRVAGRGVVVVIHPDGISTEYEPLRLEVGTGAAVGRGSVIGQVDGAHGTCAVSRCLHWGARRGATYLDPMTLLAPLGPVRLLPWAISSPPRRF